YAASLPPIVLHPGEARTVWFAYAGFPPEGPRGPVQAVVLVQADGDAALELPIAYPAPGGPRWKLDKATVSLGIGGGLSPFQSGSRGGSSDLLLAPLSLEIFASWNRFFLDYGLRYEALYREAFAGGPLATGIEPSLSAGLLPWRAPLGFYGVG